MTASALEPTIQTSRQQSYAMGRRFEKSSRHRAAQSQTQVAVETKVCHTQLFEERIEVEWNESFNCSSPIRKQSALSDSRVCGSDGCYGCCATVKIPKRIFFKTVLPADLTVILFIREKDPLIGADSVSVPISAAAPCARAPNVKSAQKKALYQSSKLSLSFTENFLMLFGWCWLLPEKASSVHRLNCK